MDDAPIIGGNWATTEPRYRKPSYRPRSGKLHTLTDVELDTLDALLIMGRASSVQDIFRTVSPIYKDDSTIRYCIKRLETLKCVKRVEPGFDQLNSVGTQTKYYVVTDYGRESWNTCLEALIERMEQRGDNGLRYTRKRG